MRILPEIKVRRTTSATLFQDRIGSRSLRCRSLAMRCWNVIGVSVDEFWVDASGGAGIAPDASSTAIVDSEAGIASLRRRMRAVIGSSAVECFWRSR